ncbi:DUF2268 domain-containing protein [Lentibacillus sp. N15]|uniref:DUF2268 domain-containing protein n=1 Tax=Lentibacillus songyuanensis TaxID=3136161 RepID=UPI0031B9C8F4
MAVVQTGKWLEEYLTKKEKETSRAKIRKIQQEQISKRLISYFQPATAAEIHMHLLVNGLFSPSSNDKAIIQSLVENKCWDTIKTLLAKLRKDWDGPDVPVFIFPSDEQNRSLQTDFNGLSGLSYEDKVFLFITRHNKKVELEKLLTHEYNHVCRLQYLNKRDSKVDILDSIVLEGLAEMAVQERLGQEHIARWATIYSSSTAQRHWEKWLKSNLSVKKTQRRHVELLYGNGFIPKWAGYNAGYHMVSSYMKNTERTIKSTLDVPAETILEMSDFSR